MHTTAHALSLAPRIRLCALLLLLAQAVRAAFPGIVNGDAESGSTAPWVVTTTSAVHSQDQTSGTVLPYQGAWFFSMARTAASLCSLEQTGSLSPTTSHLTLTGQVQTEDLAQADQGEAILSVFDGGGLVLAAQTNGPLVTANFQWRPFSVDLDVPEGAATWRVAVRGKLIYGSFVNVFYDNIALTGSGPNLRITNLWHSASGETALAWTADRAGLLYRVAFATSLTQTAFAPVAPTSQWPVTQMVWTNMNPSANAIFFKILADD